MRAVKEEALCMLRRIADSETEESFQINLNLLFNSNLWNDEQHGNFKNWMNNVWLIRALFYTKIVAWSQNQKFRNSSQCLLVCKRNLFNHGDTPCFSKVQNRQKNIYIHVNRCAKWGERIYNLVKRSICTNHIKQ